MSFDVELVDESGEPVAVPRHAEGGTYVLGGTEEARLSITYNYSIYYYDQLDKDSGLRTLHNMRADDDEA